MVISEQKARQIAGAVPDPELPDITVGELGIIRDVRVHDHIVTVVITPTYIACPAIETIQTDIASVLHDAGVTDVRFERRLAPPWSTDWMSQSARDKLAGHGISPPSPPRHDVIVTLDHVTASLRDNDPETRPCPACGSTKTQEISRFGATACKALWRCLACREPFEHFKSLRPGA